MSSSISRKAASTTRSAMPSASFRPTIRRWSTRSSRRSAAPPDFPIGGRTLREVLTRRRFARARARHAVPALSPTSPAASGGRRRKALGGRRGPGRRRRNARRAGGDARNFPASGPIRRLSSRRSIRCSRGSIRSRRRRRSHPGPRRAHASMPCATTIGDRNRLGVASTFLAERVEPGDRLKVYVQKAQHFGLPADPAVPIIMIGPAPASRRSAPSCTSGWRPRRPGRNWLFFGHQRSDYDFFYEDEFAGMKAAGVLTRLSLAWSRDGDEKIYVQDRMREVGRELWAWLADGAHIYVCGDAKRMAKDVERALVDIVASHGARSTERGGRFRRRPEEARPLSAGRVLIHERRQCNRARPSVRTTCPYCGVGCGVLARPDGRGGAAIAGDPDASGEFRPALLEGLGARRDARRSTAGCCIRCCGAPTARLRASTGTRRSTTSPTAFADSHRARRAGRGRVLSLRPAADRGLLRRQQADEGLPRLGQRRHQFAAVHGLVGRRPSPRLRRRHGAGHATRTSTRPI